MRIKGVVRGTLLYGRFVTCTFFISRFMPPDDPLGRHGPSLDNFLRKKPLPAEQKRQLCPYGKVGLAPSSVPSKLLERRVE